MHPVQFLQYAAELSQDSSLGPAEYYAAHHSARAFLRALNIEPPDNHGAVWNALLSSQDPDVIKAGSELSNLHSDRRKADYALTTLSHETQNAAALAVAKATALMGKLTTCLGNPPRRAAVQGHITAWVGLIGGGGFILLP